MRLESRNEKGSRVLYELLKKDAKLAEILSVCGVAMFLVFVSFEVYHGALLMLLCTWFFYRDKLRAERRMEDLIKGNLTQQEKVKNERKH